MTDPLPTDVLAKPFTIGLRPIGDAAWLVLDEDAAPYRVEKQRLYATCFDDVNMARADTAEAQREVAELIGDALRRDYPDFEISASPHDIASAALLVPDDLLLMRRHDDGWRLVAGSLAFPASWTLAEKFDRPLERIHAPVPMDERTHMRITRIFDSLQTDTPLWRANWSLDATYSLREVRSETDDRPKNLPPSGAAHLRTELQTLHRLPESSDVLFTVRTKSRRLDTCPRATLLTLRAQFDAMDADQRAYKGLTQNAANLLEWLKTI